VREPSPVPMQQELIPDLPAFPVEFSESAEPLRLFVAEPFGPDDKGGTYTDMGLGQAGHLTQREVALLALGRAAVQASRAAGTLEMRLGQTKAPGAGADPAAIARQKSESLLHPPAGAPVVGTGSPDDFLGASGEAQPSPNAPFEMTLRELEKLAAARSVASDGGIAPTPAPETGDAPAPRGKGNQQ